MGILVNVVVVILVVVVDQPEVSPWRSGDKIPRLRIEGFGALRETGKAQHERKHRQRGISQVCSP